MPARIILEPRCENVKSAEETRTSDRRPAQAYFHSRSLIARAPILTGRWEKAVGIQCVGRSQ